MAHQAFVTTGRGLRRDSPPMRLFEKAKRLGIWNPSDIDLAQDVRDWARLNGEEQDAIQHLTALFQAGEEAVTLDLLPLILVIAEEGRLEEEMYLTTFLFEETKHTDFFQRFLDQVADRPPDLSRYHSDNYRALFTRHCLRRWVNCDTIRRRRPRCGPRPPTIWLSKGCWPRPATTPT